MTTRYNWEQIWTIHCDELAQLMKTRKAKVAKNNYDEKIDHSFSFYKAHSELDRIKEALFNKGINCSIHSAFAWLQNWFVFYLLNVVFCAAKVCTIQNYQIYYT